MKIYLDNCSLQRPLDDKTQARIRIEAEAMEEILLLCETGDLELISSEILQTEINRNPNPKRKEIALKILTAAEKVITLNEEIKNRAVEFEKRGFQPIDALHLAAAENEGVDFFCTCDDKFLKKARAQGDLKIRIVSPLELAGEVFYEQRTRNFS